MYRPQTNDMFSSRIIEMSSDVLDQVIMFIKASSCRISLQLDESTDVRNMKQLIILVRLVRMDCLWMNF